jgi:hypothetical protein
MRMTAETDVTQQKEMLRAVLFRWLSVMFGVSRGHDRALPSFLASDHASMVDCPSAAPGLRLLSSARAFSSIGAGGFLIHAFVPEFALFPLLVAAGFAVAVLAARQLEKMLQTLASERYAGCLATEAKLRRQSAPRAEALLGVSRASALATAHLVRMRAAIGFMMLCLAALAVGAAASLWLSFLAASAFYGLFNAFFGHRARNGLDPVAINAIHAVLSQPKPSLLWDDAR